MNVILFFFFSCSRSYTNINEYEHLKKRPSPNVNRGGSRGKVRSGRGRGGIMGGLWFLQRQDGILLLNFQGWNIYLAYSGSCVRKKKMNQRSNPSIKNSWIQLCLSAFRHADDTHNVMTFRKILTNSGSSETTRSQVGLMSECAALMKLTAPLE